MGVITSGTYDYHTQGTTWVAGGLIPHKPYYFYVTARNDTGGWAYIFSDSQPSSVIRVVPNGPRKRSQKSRSWDRMCDCQHGASVSITAPGGSGSSAGEPVDLATGDETYEPAPDLSVYNPNGPSAYFQCTYSSDAALGGGSTPGLSPGWHHNYDVSVRDLTPDGSWRPLTLCMPDEGDDTLTPVLDGDGLRPAI